MIGDKERIKSFLQEETTRVLGAKYLDIKKSDYDDDDFSWDLEQTYKKVTLLCETYNLELPEVLIKYKDVKNLKEFLK